MEYIKNTAETVEVNEAPKVKVFPCVPVTSRELKDKGILLSSLIEVTKLGLYGFNSEIIEGMHEYKIFPTTYNLKGKFYVSKDLIFGAVETLLINAIRLYEVVNKEEEINQKIAEVAVPVEVVDGELVEKKVAE